MTANNHANNHAETDQDAGYPSCYEVLTPEDKEEIYHRARRRARAKLAFGIHCIAFAVVMGLLVLINLAASPGTWWVIWPLFAWGLGLLMHWLFGVRFLGFYRALQEREIAKELEREMGN